VDGFLNESDYSNQVQIVTAPAAMVMDEYARPQHFALKQNYPNPFNPVTMISYSVPRPAFVRLELFDLQGRRVSVMVNELQQAGYYQKTVDGSSLSSGIYLYRLTADKFQQVRRMLLLR
jgi:hypothetical protein